MKTPGALLGCAFLVVGNISNSALAQNLAGASTLTRRQFLKNSGLAVVAGTLAAPKGVAQSAVSPGQTLRVGLIGCGGRGTGAATQALAADPNVKLVALGDAFRDRLYEWDAKPPVSVAAIPGVTKLV